MVKLVIFINRIALAIVMAKKVVFAPREFSDALALATLYEGIEPHPELDPYFERSAHGLPKRGFPYLSGARYSNVHKNIDLVVASYSDYTDVHSAENPTLQIDQMVMKNCSGLWSDSDVTKVRTEFRMPKDKPSVVLSYAYDLERRDLETILKPLRKRAHVYLVGTYPGSSWLDDFASRGQITTIKKYGILRRLFAGADISLFGPNIIYPRKLCHNFLEATVSGPLIMIPPIRSLYGYKELCDAGAIIPCKSMLDVIETLSSYIDCFSSSTRQEYQAGPGKLRRTHILQARERYLPIIRSHILAELELAEPMPSDLRLHRAIRQGGSKAVRLMHPDTNWRDDDDTFSYFFDQPKYMTFW